MVKTLSLLHPAQRFLYEYGAFVSFWGHFEMSLEVLSLLLQKPDSAAWTNTEVQNHCQRINPKTAGGKREVVLTQIAHAPEDYTDIGEAIKKVFQVAERNDWIHCVILNPKGDFSEMRRLRIHQPFRVENTAVAFEGATEDFAAFYQAYGEFEQVVNRRFPPGLIQGANRYLVKLQSRP